MRRYKTSGRSSTINHAFASALAMVDLYDEAALKDALTVLGQPEDGPLICSYCAQPAKTLDHLHGLVEDSTYTGHGHVIGNLVPCCNDCNQRKGKRPWREWAQSVGASPEQIQRIEEYESSAPESVSQDALAQLYPDLMAAYERLRLLCHDLLKTADNLASEIHRLEGKRLKRDFD